MEERNPVIEMSTDSDWGSFLEDVLGLQIHPKDPQWERKLLEQSPNMGPYLVAGAQNSISNEGASVILDCPDLRESSRKSLQISWDAILDEIGSIIAIACAAGGSKAFIDLLKAWVEERSGRKIKIKRGDIELEFQGGISEKELKRAIELFEESYGESKVLIP